MGHGTYTYKPTNGLTKWLDSRLPIVRFVDEHLMQFPTPKNLNYWYTFGAILTVMLVVQILSGVVLAMHYVPHEAMAFDSIERIMRDVPYGWLLRYMHSNGASMFFVAVYIHIFRGLYYGSYQQPREVLWILGIIIYLLMMATGFLGYTLPWGQMSFWGATVITNFFSAIPVVGPSITEWLWGSFAVDNSTLQRFFSLHYLLPFVIAGVVVLHIWALHVPGNNNPLGIDVKGPADTVPFHPYYTMKDGFGIVVFLLIFAVFIFFMPNAMGHADNYVQANRLVTPTHIVPEWYYLPFYAILRSVPDKLIGVLLLFAGIFVWALLPWLDRSHVRSSSFRPVYRYLFFILIVDVAILGYLGAQTADDSNVVIPFTGGVEFPIGKLLLAQIATFYYFLHFLVLTPLVSLWETPLPVPESISKAVLAKKGVSAAPAAAE